jgi:hypothetical protein
MQLEMRRSNATKLTDLIGSSQKKFEDLSVAIADTQVLT